MPQRPRPFRFPRLAGWPPSAQWLTLLAISLLLAAGLESLDLAAGVLMGAMAGAILLAAAGADLAVPRTAFYLAQGAIGCLIATSITPPLLREMLYNWPVFLLTLMAVVGASVALGAALTWFRILPGTTAIWGAFPGAATAMVLMADAYGADSRLVAFMQYLRVVCVVVVASLVAEIWVPQAAEAALAGKVWFPAIHWLAFGETLALAVVSAGLALAFNIPAGGLILSMLFGVLLQDFGLLRIELPPWLLALSYFLVGWGIGLRFTRPLLLYALRALPWLIAAIVALITLCGLFALVLSLATGIDPLTAYLATSPGGADSVAIIAASTDVDMPFVMAMQIARFIAVLLVGPSLARLIAERIDKRGKTAPPAA
ncbi:AbrB family transcriptional regulator [Afifella aestuarii]|uniref:AbrB family transcriptional regulator n=1 Tax=Afifella aestuarii TaxID=1909496 RepID=UPI000FE40473|nr:AbrB family transcriptional regulator [Afifella aestuarii]